MDRYFREGFEKLAAALPAKAPNIDVKGIGSKLKSAFGFGKKVNIPKNYDQFSHIAKGPASVSKYKGPGLMRASGTGPGGPRSPFGGG